MMAELAALVAIMILPAGLTIAILTILSIGLAGLSSDDLDEGRLLRN
jgi:hypothetical protein